MKPSEARLALNTALAILALVALRLIAAAFTPITFDEAYYWMWSKHLAGGYYDHPPMVAVVIRLGTLIAGDTEFGVRLVSILLALPMSWAIYQTAVILFGGRRVADVVGDPSERHADGRRRHHDRHAGCAASGRFELPAVCARQGAADRSRRVVAGGRRRRRLRAAVEIHRAVLRAGDPDLADRRSQAAALAGLAMALSRRARRARDVCAGHPVERRPSLGFLHQADGTGENRGFPPGLHRRVDPDADRVRDAAGMDPRRDGALCALSPPRRGAAGGACWSTRCSGSSSPISSGIRCMPASRPTGLRRSIRRLRSPPRSPRIWCDGSRGGSAWSTSAGAGRRRGAC